MPLATLTLHATQRCQTRGIPKTAVEAAIDYGRHFYARGADHYIIGWREVRYWAEFGIDLSRFRGVQVVCASGGEVLTTYRKRRSGRLGHQLRNTDKRAA